MSQSDKDHLEEKLGSPAGADHAVDLAAVKTEVDKVPKSDGVAVWNATAQTTIQTKAAAALTAYDPPTKAEMDSGHSPLATTTELNKVPKSDGSTIWNSTALQAIQDEAEDALEGENLDQLVKIALTTSMDADVNDDSVIGEMLTKSALSNWDRTVMSLEALAEAIAVSKNSATATGTIVEDSAMGTGSPDMTEITSSASGDTFGGYAQVDASVSADSWICSIMVLPDNTYGADTNIVIEIATGPGASEVAKIRFSFGFELLTNVGAYAAFQYCLPIPIKVASGTRIAARVADGEAAANVCRIGVQYYQGLET